jgi:hypothetical protein
MLASPKRPPRRRILVGVVVAELSVLLAPGAKHAFFV